ncbi:hypothetical protein ACEWY4_011941 [Coilia grayii]|uniref:Ig-like domain-containing protein n=1 Tax=Coilia grayii TaxID=363190 RepID=A0ABD1JZ32_9TELE
MLICFVNHFYPPSITVRWTRNNMAVTDGVNQSRYRMNTDATFHLFSTLDFTPQEGDIYACTVEHQALAQPSTQILVESFQQCIYDKVFVMKFNRSTLTFTGYTQFTTELARKWNKDGGMQRKMVSSVDGICRGSMALNKQLKNHVTQPYIKLHQVFPARHGSPAILQCSVYGFYPRQIRVSWRRNGQEVTTDVTSTQVLSDGHWSYQAHSRLVLQLGPDSMETSPVWWSMPASLSQHSTTGVRVLYNHLPS